MALSHSFCRPLVFCMLGSGVSAIGMSCLCGDPGTGKTLQMYTIAHLQSPREKYGIFVSWDQNLSLRLPEPHVTWMRLLDLGSARIEKRQLR